MGAAFYRSGQAAQMLGISAHSIRRLGETGLIEAELSDGGQWRIPVSEIERLKREGIPPIPSSADGEGEEQDGEEEDCKEAADHRLLAPPSKDVVISAEDVVMAENCLKKLKVERETEETRDWFRERKRLKTEMKAKKRQTEAERNARTEAEKARIAWEDSWLAAALVSVPKDAPADSRLGVRENVAETLAGLGPQNSAEVVRPLVVAAVLKALEPWLKEKETAKAIVAACDTLPWDAKSYSKPSVWQIRANEVVAAAIRKLPWDSPYDMKLEAGTAAVQPISREYEDSAMREALLREAYLWDIDYAQQEEAKEAIQEALKELPKGTARKILERSREQVLARFRETRKRREQDAAQQQRAERKLPHLRHYLEEMQKVGQVQFDDYLDLLNFCSRITPRIRKAVLEELQRQDLSDEEIEALIEQSVEELLDE